MESHNKIIKSYISPRWKLSSSLHNIYIYIFFIIFGLLTVQMLTLCSFSHCQLVENRGKHPSMSVVFVKIKIYLYKGS